MTAYRNCQTSVFAPAYLLAKDVKEPVIRPFKVVLIEREPHITWRRRVARIILPVKELRRLRISVYMKGEWNGEEMKRL